MSALPEDVLADLDERARIGVFGGYEPLDELREALIEVVQHDPDTEDAFAADPDGARAAIDAILARHADGHAAAERSFPPETDPERLTAVLAELDARGVVAGEDVGFTLSDVVADMGELVRARRDARGWVAFHRQDLERVVDGLPLMLAFGDLPDGADEQMAAIGREIVDALRAAGFSVSWTGRADARIQVDGIRWQRRRPTPSPPSGRLARLLRRRP